MVKDWRVGQVCWGVTRRLAVALRLLERPSGVSVTAQNLRAAVTQRTLIVALEKRTKGYLIGG